MRDPQTIDPASPRAPRWVSNLLGTLYHDPTRRALMTLVLTTILSAGLVYSRGLWAGRGTYHFLLWNMFLAWLPVICGLIAQWTARRGLGLPTLMAGVAWLAFFPNAPYIVTDLMHLRTTFNAPLWVDVIMLASCAWTGIVLGLASLRMMHELVRQTTRSWTWAWAFALASCLLGGLGVYLGRFLRWNTWDLVTNPTGLLSDTLTTLVTPRAVVFTAAFGAFYFVLYLTVTALAWRPAAPLTVTADGSPLSS